MNSFRRQGGILVGCLLLFICAALLSCHRSKQLHSSSDVAGSGALVTAPAAMPAPPPKPARRRAPAPSPQPPSAAIELDHAIGKLGQGFRGRVGLAVRDIQTGWTSDYRGLEYFPQQSVSKLWVSIAVLDQVDQRRFDLSRSVTVREKDLTLFHQPIRALAIRPGGYRTTPDDLMRRALTQSDNSANDILLREAGGPDAVRSMLEDKSIAGIRFGPGEKKLQASIAGLVWPTDWDGGGGFYTARDALPSDRRQAAFDAYVADPVDGATPLGLVDALARLEKGQLLSPESTARITAIMQQTRTGALRLKSGVPSGWTLAHKTGTGQVLDGEQAGYNDVGILTSPEGRSYAVAVMIGRTSRPLKERMILMQKVVEATIAYDHALAKQQASVPERHDPAEASPASEDRYQIRTRASGGR